MNGDGGCTHSFLTASTRAYGSSYQLDPKVQQPSGAVPHLSCEPGEFLQWPLSHDDSTINIFLVLFIIIIIFFWPSVLDSRRYKILSKVRPQRRSHFWVGKSGLKRDCISPLECYRKPLEQEHGLPGVFCDRADTSANLWDQVNRQPIHHAWSLEGDWKEDVSAG